MNHRLLLIAIISFFIIGAVYLAYSERMQAQYDYQQTWWATYFGEQSNDFVIENHGSKDAFTWSAFLNDTQIAKEAVTVKPGNTARITVPITSDAAGKTLVITISNGKESKEIHKQL